MKYNPFFFISFVIILFITMLGTFSNANGGKGMNPLEGTIVFTTGGITSEGGGIYIADVKNIEGTIRNIFKERVFIFETSWSPDGSMVLFAKDNMTDPLSNLPRYELMLIDREGNNLKKVLDMGKTPCGYPSWSPDGSKIAFLAGDNIYHDPTLDELWGGELFVSSVDGSNIKKITNITLSSNRPSWTPDSKKIIFASKDWRIYSVNLDGTDLKEITRGMAPSVSPNGKKIAFRDSRNIHICDIDGENKKMLVRNYDRVLFFSIYHGYGYPTEFAWSPDGQYLLYARSAWGISSDIVLVFINKPYKKIKLYTIGGMEGISWTRE